MERKFSLKSKLLFQGLLFVIIIRYVIDEVLFNSLGVRLNLCEYAVIGIYICSFAYFILFFFSHSILPMELEVNPVVEWIWLTMIVLFKPKDICLICKINIIDIFLEKPLFLLIETLFTIIQVVFWLGTTYLFGYRERIKNYYKNKT